MKWRPKNGWNEIAESEIKRLTDPYPNSERTYFEAGASAFGEALLAEIDGLLEERAKIPLMGLTPAQFIREKLEGK